MPSVSVVVLAYNNADTISECLSTLQTQNYQNWRIVLVCDKASTDGTEEVVDDCVRTSNSIVVVKCFSVGRSKARNIGWRSSEDAIVMFADGDDVYEPDYIEKAVAALSSKRNLGGACLGGTALIKGTTLMDRFNLAYGSTDDRMLRRAEYFDPEWAWVYKREAIEKVGGFDEELTQAEDKDLCRRVKEIGYRIAYIQGTNWHHRKPRTLGKFISKEYSSGKRRTVYDFKVGDYKSIMVGLAPCLLILLGLIVGSVFNWIYSSIALAIGIALYTSLFSNTHHGSIASASELVVLAMVGLIGRTSNSLGMVYGIVILAAKRLGLVGLDLGRL